MFWKAVNLVLFLAVAAFLFERWRRLKRERRQFLEKRDRLQGLSGSGDEKSN